MRFIENGPSIPDELLLARDEGRVVFFCGAGVSRAEADLPDFFGLVEKVIDTLGVVSDSPVRTVFNHAKKIEQATNVPGLISADRLFGLLEREFHRADIEKAVAQILKPKKPEKLSAHQSLIDLARTSTGLVRIVTTNFDRLFNSCEPELKSWVPPKLPDPNRPKELDGIVYLHGRVTEDYSSAEDDGFILSSGEFGRAYLAQAWATDFFKSILRKYVVVFVGYTADDPPVHYLLEALSQGDSKLEKIYAFQSGDPEDARSKWQHKGVEAIAYDNSNNHKALWVSLKLWAERAKNIDGWYQNVLKKALQGPREMLPHERGQVAHIVSSVEGIKHFQSFNPALPAEWLMVFDKYCRYETPSRSGGLLELEKGPEIDPFELYCIDSDPAPVKVSSESYTAKRECPASAWDAFEINTFDSHEIRPYQIPVVRGWKASKATALCARLQELIYWFGKVSIHPVALWWAVRQSELHSSVIDQLQWHLDREDLKGFPDIDKAWRYLIEAKAQNFNELAGDWYNLEDRINGEGLSRNTVRQYLEYLEPKLQISAGITRISFDEGISPRAICRPVLHFPVPESTLDIDDNWLKQVVEGVRKHLEFAIELEQELEGHAFSDLNTLTPEANERIYDNSGSSEYVMRFAKLFKQLMVFDFDSAYQEYACWGTDPFGVFSLLKVWALRNTGFGDASVLEDVFIQELSDKDFWSGSHSRDIVLTLKSRWKDFSPDSLDKLEKRILDGPEKWDSDEEGYLVRKTWRILDRIQWLDDNDCELSVDIDKLKSKLNAIVPDWKPESSLEEARTTRVRGGTVRTETNYSELLNLPLGRVLARALELRGKTDNFLIEAEPFKGFVDDYPKKAITCLNLAVKRNEPAEWAWHIFLRAEGRQEDSPEFISLLVNRFISYSENFWLPLVRDIAEWLKKVSDKLFTYRSDSYYLVLDKFISLALKHPDLFATSVTSVSGRPPDFVMEAINSPISPIIQSMFDDPHLEKIKEGGALPTAWLHRIQKLLEVGNRVSLLAMVICNHNLNWFFHWAEEWTCENLLKYQVSEDDLELDAFWSGFFWGAKVPVPKLFRIVKAPLIKFANEGSCSRDGYGKVLAGVLLAGWGDEDKETNSPYISSTEFRELLVNADEDFRCSVITQLRAWSLESREGNHWPNQLEKFLSDVWPKQITAKSPATTVRLCELVFSNQNIFSRIGSVVLPLLVKVDSSRLSFPGIRKSEEIIKNYPQEVLAICHQVLSDDSRNWPYKMEEIFDTLESARSDIRFDERFIELRRKWDSR